MVARRWTERRADARRPGSRPRTAAGTGQRRGRPDNDVDTAAHHRRCGRGGSTRQTIAGQRLPARRRVPGEPGAKSARHSRSAPPSPRRARSREGNHRVLPSRLGEKSQRVGSARLSYPCCKSESCPASVSEILAGRPRPRCPTDLAARSLDQTFVEQAVQVPANCGVGESQPLSNRRRGRRALQQDLDDPVAGTAGQLAVGSCRTRRGELAVGFTTPLFRKSWPSANPPRPAARFLDSARDYAGRRGGRPGQAVPRSTGHRRRLARHIPG